MADSRAVLTHDQRKPPAKRIGYLDGEATSFWVVCGDAESLVQWKGVEGSSVSEDVSDFDRALNVIDESDDADIVVGDSRAAVIAVGESGASHAWRIEDGVALWSYRRALTVDESTPDYETELGARVTGLAAQDTIRIGSVDVPSGCLEILVPFAMGATAEQVKAARRGDAPNEDEKARVVVLVPPGVYDIFDDALGASHGLWCADELGRYQNRIRIVKRQRA